MANSLFFYHNLIRRVMIYYQIRSYKCLKDVCLHVYCTDVVSSWQYLCKKVLTLVNTFNSIVASYVSYRLSEHQRLDFSSNLFSSFSLLVFFQLASLCHGLGSVSFDMHIIYAYTFRVLIISILIINHRASDHIMRGKM